MVHISAFFYLVFYAKKRSYVLKRERFMQKVM